MKQQLAVLERDLTSLRVQGHELHCQATAFYVNLSRISGQVTTSALNLELANQNCCFVLLQSISMPEFLKENEDKEESLEQHKYVWCNGAAPNSACAFIGVTKTPLIVLQAHYTSHTLTFKTVL